MKLKLATLPLALLAIGHSPPAAADSASAKSHITVSPMSLDEIYAGGGVSRTTVCFTVHNGTDPVASTVTGTLYRRGATFDSTTPAVVLAHGLAGDRSVWDISMAAPLAQSTNLASISFAPSLARAGYAVITYDRLGYGQSPYHGLGKEITADTQTGMLHEIVTQVHDGTYRVLSRGTNCAEAGRAPSFGSDTVVIGGHSFGGFMVSSYAGLYHDVAAVIPMGSSTRGTSNEAINDLVIPWLLPQAIANDYVRFFPPNPNGPTSPECLRFFFYTDGADPEVYNTICDNDHIGVDTVRLIPSGEILSQPKFAEVDTPERIRSIGDIPVLLAYADHERFFKGPEEATADDPDVQTPELAYYQENCGCDVSMFDQEQSGHMFLWHRSAAETAGFVIGWLKSHGISN